MDEKAKEPTLSENKRTQNLIFDEDEIYEK